MNVTPTRVIVTLDLSKGFSSSEIKVIDRAAECQKISRDEFLAKAIQTGLKRARSDKEPDSVTTDLERHSRDMGIPVDELRWICLRAGLDQLNTAEVKIKALDGKLPLMLPSWIVKRLADAGRVAGLDNPDTAIAEAILGDLDPISIKEIALDAFVVKSPKATGKRLDKLIAGWAARVS